MTQPTFGEAAQPRPDDEIQTVLVVGAPPDDPGVLRGATLRRGRAGGLAAVTR